MNHGPAPNNEQRDTHGLRSDMSATALSALLADGMALQAHLMLLERKHYSCPAGVLGGRCLSLQRLLPRRLLLRRPPYAVVVVSVAGVAVVVHLPGRHLHFCCLKKHSKTSW